MRLIDADALKKPIYAEDDNITGVGMTYSEMDGYNDGIDATWGRIESAPTIDAVPVRHGHWIHENAWYPPTCSMCGGSPKTPGFIGNVEFYEKYFRSCPNCGAKMDEVSE